MRLDRSGQQKNLSMGKRRPGINGIPPLYGRYPQTSSCTAKRRCKAIICGKPADCLWPYVGQIPDSISNLPQPSAIEIPVWQLGITDEDIMGRPIITTEDGYNAGILFYHVKDGILKVRMPAYSGAVFASHPEDFYPVLPSRFVEEGEEEAREKEQLEKAAEA